MFSGATHKVGIASAVACGVTVSSPTRERSSSPMEAAAEACVSGCRATLSIIRFHPPGEALWCVVFPRDGNRVPMAVVHALFPAGRAPNSMGGARSQPPSEATTVLVQMRRDAAGSRAHRRPRAEIYQHP